MVRAVGFIFDVVYNCYGLCFRNYFDLLSILCCVFLLIMQWLGLKSARLSAGEMIDIGIVQLCFVVVLSCPFYLCFPINAQ